MKEIYLFLLFIPCTLSAQEQLTFEPGPIAGNNYLYAGLYQQQLIYGIPEINSSDLNIYQDDLADSTWAPNVVATVDISDQFPFRGPYVIGDYVVVFQRGRLTIVSLEDQSVKEVPFSENLPEPTISFEVNNQFYLFDALNQFFQVDLQTGSKTQLTEPLSGLFEGILALYPEQDRPFSQDHPFIPSLIRTDRTHIYEYNLNTSEIEVRETIVNLDFVSVGEDRIPYLQNFEGDIWAINRNAAGIEVNKVTENTLLEFPQVKVAKNDYTILQGNFGSGRRCEVVDKMGNLINSYTVPVITGPTIVGRNQNGYYQDRNFDQDNLEYHLSDESGTISVHRLTCPQPRLLSSPESEFDFLTCNTENPLTKAVYLTNGTSFELVDSFTIHFNLVYEPSAEATYFSTYGRTAGQIFHKKKGPEFIRLSPPGTTPQGYFYAFAKSAEDIIAFNPSTQQKSTLFSIKESAIPIFGLDPLDRLASKTMISTDQYFFYQDGSCANDEIYRIDKTNRAAEKLTVSVPGESALEIFEFGKTFLGGLLRTADFRRSAPVQLNNEGQLISQASALQTDNWTANDFVIINDKMIAPLLTPEKRIAVYEIQFPIQEKAVQLTPMGSRIEPIARPFGRLVKGKTHVYFSLQDGHYITNGTQEGIIPVSPPYVDPIYNKGQFFSNDWMFDERTGQLTTFNRIEASILAGSNGKFLYNQNNEDLMLYEIDQDRHSSLISLSGFNSQDAFSGTSFIYFFKNRNTIVAIDLNDVNVNEIVLDGVISSFSSSQVRVINNQLVFIAYQEATGREIWTTDGTEAGTRMVFDINPDAKSSFPDNFFYNGNDFYFSAYVDEIGRQLYRSPVNIVVNTKTPPSAQPAIKLYPSPTKDWLQVEWEADEPFDIEVIDALGRVQFHQNGIQESPLQINTQQWQSGWYFCRARQKGSYVTIQKFVKTN